MATYFRSHVSGPLPFAVMNLYDVSFAVSALTLGVVLRRRFPEYPYRIDFGFFSIVMAATLYVASGMVPLVAAPNLVKAGDASALNALEGISAGLLLGGTMASGFALFVLGWVGFSSKRLPFLLSGLMLSAGLLELAEWRVPVILILDPLFGSFGAYGLEASYG